MMFRQSRQSRRRFLSLIGTAGLGALLPGFGSFGRAQAQSAAAAEQLVNRAVADVMSTINSGRSEASMLRDFQNIFRDYGDVPVIARSVLGPPARTASAAQMRAFTEAFGIYIANKYGRRFREFIGSTITVTGSRQVRSFREVISVVNQPGYAPYDLRWFVSDGSGSPRFFNLIIEGVNLMISERTEIGAMLEARGGDIDRLARDLRAM
ncbi:ABC transporter substrate-binding protein [Roseibacterium beibuensis]|uniref:ABC transporter substrate-binding protein n=1 Tax=[Roseibacterium] beibuensis TaxID=1193142 RepID=A0ABP9LG21_9RHOB|nr:ABC transporter substrate-binding protein [Roseibacterium beibuensis]MCS6626600.1 ABC transporter substrate-binding protein [Roseibacterium beibuensis]